MGKKTYYLEITEANHKDNQFYTLGGAGWDTGRERNEAYKAVPGYKHDCDNDDKCYFLDVLNEEGRIKEKEISPESVRTLLGEPIEVLRDRAIKILDEEEAGIAKYGLSEWIKIRDSELTA